MLDKLKPYPLYFVQKASPGEGDAFDFSYIYKFYSDRTERYQRLKYIIRVEQYDDVFAVKFYAARDRKLEQKYNRIIHAHGYSGAVRVFFTCALVISELHAKFPEHSFVVCGAESHDRVGGKVEDKNSNQRFRIYRAMALQLFGHDTFEHYQQTEASTYTLVNRSGSEDMESKYERIKQMFFSRGFGD
jgi:hypothetical protein